MPNRLAASTSLYLRQHAANPVDWWEWSADAFEEAARRDLPVLVSIGYAACHWCHVMAHESFEDPEIALLMNKRFVCIKVDREERPDVDAVYIGAVQAMTGHAGWPLTVFVTPQGQPFYGGTYFPPRGRHGLPGFADLLNGVAEAWAVRRDEVKESAASLTAALAQAARSTAETTDLPGPELIEAATSHILAELDRRWGGFGGAPKFPHCTTLGFLLRQYIRTGQEPLLEAARLTLRAMADGGIHDQLAGGFHRYSTDATWTVPHFEKMLYDNAQLASVYLDAWLVTGELGFRQVAVSTLDFLVAEMRSPEGAFWSTIDADTAEGEGAYYAWNRDQLRQALADDAVADLAAAWFGVTDLGNFEHGLSVLTTRRRLDDVAKAHGLDAEDPREQLGAIMIELRRHRSTRPAPAVDPKIIVAWNALAISAFARAGAALERPDYVDVAEEAAAFVQTKVVDADGLRHSWAEGKLGPRGFQDDYAAWTLALTDLYEATFNPEHLRDASRFAHEMLAQFGPVDGALTFAGLQHESLASPTYDWFDSALPSGNAMAVAGLRRLAGYLDDSGFRDRAEAITRSGSELVERAPTATGTLLMSIADALSPGPELAIIGNLDPGGEGPDLLREVRRHLLPGALVAWARSDQDADAGPIPWLKGRPLAQGRATAYLCHDYTCQSPVTTAEALCDQLMTEFPALKRRTLP